MVDVRGGSMFAVLQDPTNTITVVCPKLSSEEFLKLVAELRKHVDTGSVRASDLSRAAFGKLRTIPMTCLQAAAKEIGCDVRRESSGNAVVITLSKLAA